MKWPWSKPSEPVTDPEIVYVHFWRGGLDPFSVAKVSEEGRRAKAEMINPMTSQLVDIDVGEWLIPGPETWDGFVVYSLNGERLFWKEMWGLRPGYAFKFADNP